MKVILGVIIGAALVIGTIFLTVNYIDKGRCNCATEHVVEEQTYPRTYINDDGEKVTEYENKQTIEGDGYVREITIH